MQLFTMNNVRTQQSGLNRVAATTVYPVVKYRGADKSLARPGRKQATATEDFDVHISYL